MRLYDILCYFYIMCYLFTLSNCIEECPNIVKINNSRRYDRTNRHRLRLVQYNVEWLFVEHNSHFDCPGSKCTWKNKTHAIEHLNDVSNIITELNPDIINLCEVESCYELNMLVELSNKEYAPYLKFGTDSGTGQNVGMLSKIIPEIPLYRNEDKLEYPVIGSNCGINLDDGSTGVSKHYITEFNISGINIAFIGVHLIAYPTEPKRCSQREAQAQIIQNIIYNYIKKGYEVIVIGDMNDYDNELLDVNSNKPLSRTLDIIKGLSGEVYSGKYILQSVASKMQMVDRYSEWWNSDNDCNITSIKEYSMIDHVLMTPTLFQYVDNAFIYHGYQEYCDKIHSDHFPVVVDFIFE